MAKGKGKGNSNGVKYSKTVTKAVSNWKLDKDVINAASAKEIRKELNRVFHAANRRLQNIENAGVFSPAAAAVNAYLENDQVSQFNKFAKFTTAGKGLNELKRDYAAAIEFLKKPTSTASGARQFETEIKQRMKMTDAQFNAIKSIIADGSGVSDYGNMIALIPSDPTKVTDFFREQTIDIADEIENAAENLDGTAPLKAALKTDLDNDYKSGITADFVALHDAFEDFES